MFTAFEKYKKELEGVQSQTKEVGQGVNEAGEGKVTDAVNQQSEQVGSNPVAQDAVVFRVQIETSETKIPSNSSRFKGRSVLEYKQDNLYKYTTGEFINDFKGANELKNELRQKGFPNAFVVAFQNGERISLEKAIKLAEN
jgi:N-acetylmuramoyl-L-alanine amidase